MERCSPRQNHLYGNGEKDSERPFRAYARSMKALFFFCFVRGLKASSFGGRYPMRGVHIPGESFTRHVLKQRPLFEQRFVFVVILLFLPTVQVIGKSAHFQLAL